MLAEDRRSYILKLLETRSSVTVTELSTAFGLSEVSVRKLLSNMEQEGLIKRTWGGAVSAYGSLREFSHKEKEPVCLPKNFPLHGLPTTVSRTVTLSFWGAAPPQSSWPA